MGRTKLSLQAWLDRRPLLDVPACVSLVSALLETLGELHAMGEILHNLDPREMTIIQRSGSGHFEVHDVGPWHLPDPNVPPQTLIRDAQVLVDLRYLSPEAIRRRPLDARHDLFLVGLVLHQLLTGAHPFEADSDLARMTAILAGLTETPRFPPGRDHPALVGLVRRLLAPDPADRPASAAQARAELMRALEAPEPAPEIPRPPSTAPTRRAASGVLAIASPATLEAGSYGLREVSQETVAAFMGRLFDEGTSGDDASREPGHVVLPAPVVHPFAMGHADSPLSLLLELSDETLWQVQLVQRWIVVRAEGNAPVRAGQVITEEQIDTQALYDHPDDVEVRSGTDAIGHLLASLDLAAELERAREAVEHAEADTLARADKRLALLDRYLRNGIDPTSLILTTLPIVPRALRQRGTPAYDLDDLYRRVLSASTRLSLMHRAAAPVMVERHQRENLTRNIEALFANGRGGRLFTTKEPDQVGPRKFRALFSLTDLLRSLSLDVSGVFEGHRVFVRATDEAAAALRGVGLHIVDG